MKSIKDTAGLILFLLLLSFLVNRILGCTPAETKEAAADVTYAGQQLECVDKFKPVQKEIDACRDSVKARWAAKDAGGDQ